eukprot:75159-Pyramimonas_sp.AAC.1
MIVPELEDHRGSDGPCQAKRFAVSMTSSAPRNEARSCVGSRPHEHKRPRANARHLSLLPRPPLKQ